MKLKKLEAALAAGIIFALLAGYACIREQRELVRKVIRLHVIANSDTPQDQELKLEVRDRIIEAADDLLDGEKDPEKAARIIYENLPYFEKKAGEIVEKNGYKYDVRAEFGPEEYATREYDNFALPAGSYNSLKILIGEGRGQNWWCVVFPPLCLTAASEFRETAEAAGMTDEEIRLISEKGNEVVFKFKILELLQKINEFLKECF